MATIKRIRDFLALERNILVLGVSSMVGSFGSNLWMNILSLYISDELHANPFEVGLVFTIGGLASASLMIPIGYLADKIGKKKVVVVGCYIISFTTVLFAFTRNWIEIIPVLFVYNAAWSYRPVMSALIADSVVKRRRATGFAIFSVLPNITIIFASGFGGYLSETMGFQPLFMLATVFMLTMTLMRHLFLKEPEETAEKSTRTFVSPFEGIKYIRKGSKSLRAYFVFICFGSFFGSFIYPQYYSLFAQDMLGLSRTQIGFSFAVSQAFTTLFTLPGGKLADHYGRKKLMLLSSITGPSLLIFYIFAPNALAVYLISAISGMFGGLSNPSFQAIQADLIPRGKRGTMMGLFAAARNVLGVPSPTIGGYLWYSYEPRMPFYVYAFSSMISFLILLFFIKETLTGKEE